MTNIIEYMNERKEVSRWLIVRVVLVGVFLGAVLSFLFFLLGFVG